MYKFLAALLVGAIAMLCVTPVEAQPPTGEPLTILGPFAVGGPEADAFVAELEAYSPGRAGDVIYEEYFGNADLLARLAGPSPPDLIVVPQPGVLVDLAPELVDLAGWLNETTLRRDFSDGLIDLASADGVALGVPIKVDLKSLVWYQPDEFAARGYDIPETFAELIALSDSMVANGQTPWCNYIESGFATGWMGTDWVEDLLLGAEGPAVYDQWIAHDVLFTDPRVEAAFERFLFTMDTPGYVFDRANMLNVSFFANAVPLGFGDCLMHKQASFFAAASQFFGFGLDDFATFKFPSVDPAFSDATVGGGVYVAAVTDSNDVRQLTRFLASQRFGRAALASAGTGWIMPNERFDTTRYTSELTRSFAETVRAAIAADQFRFDASDLMPSEVGVGTFWTAMVDIISGAKTIPQVLDDVDASWPT